MGPSNNQQRKAWWQAMHRLHTKEQIDAAIASLPPDTQRVLRLHYGQNMPLQEITGILGRNITTIRTRQVMGIYKLWQYFGRPAFLSPVR